MLLGGCLVPDVQLSCRSGSLPDLRTGPAKTQTETPPPVDAPATVTTPRASGQPTVSPPPLRTSPASSAFDPPEGAVTPRDPEAIAFAFHRVDFSPEITMPAGRAPQGVRVATRSSKTDKGFVFEIDRVPGETLAQTFARVRPWFDTIELPAAQRWMFGLVRPASEDERLEIEVVERASIPVYGSDIAWVVARPGRVGGVELGLSAKGRARLPEATAALVGQTYAIAIGDRMLWAPQFGASFGNRDVESLGFQRDPVFTATLRDAIAGDPEAVRALAEDRLTDGGTPEEVAAAREAALPPAPTTGADGRTKVTFEPREGDRSSASFVVPADFVFESRSEFGVDWKRSQPPSYLDISTLGCSPCTDAEIAARVEAACVELLQPRPREGKVEQVETILDATEDGTRRCGRVRKGAGYGGTDEILLHCHRQHLGHERAFVVSLRTWAPDRAAVLDEFGKICASVRTE